MPPTGLSHGASAQALAGENLENNANKLQTTFNIEFFPDETTDGSGEVDLVLSSTPTDIKSISVFAGKPDRIAVIKSLAGNTLTIIVYKNEYLKTTAIDGSGAITDLPASVSEATTLQILNTNTSGEGHEAGSGTATANIHTHNTSMGFSYAHGHDTITQASTKLELANTDANNHFTIIYDR